MNRMIFVNLPVTDLERSIAFYEAIGATADPYFKGGGAQMMRVSEEICVMLLTHERFSCFTSRRIADAHETAQVLLCLSCGGRDEVNATTQAAAAAGGQADPNPPQEHGDFMYGRSFADPDGHIWELAWMDVAAAMAAGAAQDA